MSIVLTSLTLNNRAQQWDAGPKYESKIFDFAVTGLQEAGANQYVAKIVTFDKPVFIHEVLLRVITAEGEACTLDVGTCSATGAAVDWDGFLDGVDGNAAAGTIYSSRQILSLGEGTPNTIAYTAYYNGVYVLGTVAAPISVCLQVATLNGSDATANVGKYEVTVIYREATSA